jgi:hypothetical protein
MTENDTKPKPDQSPKDEPATLSGEEARQGEIILDTPSKRRWYIAVLVVCVSALLVISFLR